MGIAKRVALARAQGEYIPKGILRTFAPWLEGGDVDAIESRRERALSRSDGPAYVVPRCPDPIADQVGRVPEDVLVLVESTLATVASYRDAVAAGRGAADDGVFGPLRLAQRQGRPRLMAALPPLRHFIRQGRPWDIDPYAVLRALMPRRPGPEPPDLDIYAGREPVDGHGIPEVPGTPVYAPEPAPEEKPRRSRRSRAVAAAPDPAPVPVPEAPAPGDTGVQAAPEASERSAEPGGVIHPPEAPDASGAPPRRPGRRGKSMPGQGSLFD